MKKLFQILHGSIALYQIVVVVQLCSGVICSLDCCCLSIPYSICATLDIFVSIDEYVCYYVVVTILKCQNIVQFKYPFIGADTNAVAVA